MVCRPTGWFNHQYVEWDLNGFINDISLPCRRVKKSFVQVIRIQPVHSLKMFQHTPDFKCHTIRQYSKFESSTQLQREESAKSLKIVERCFLFCKW